MGTKPHVMFQHNDNKTGGAYTHESENGGRRWWLLKARLRILEEFFAFRIRIRQNPQCYLFLEYKEKTNILSVSLLKKQTEVHTKTHMGE